MLIQRRYQLVEPVLLPLARYLFIEMYDVRSRDRLVEIVIFNCFVLLVSSHKVPCARSNATLSLDILQIAPKPALSAWQTLHRMADRIGHLPSKHVTQLRHPASEFIHPITFVGNGRTIRGQKFDHAVRERNQLGISSEILCRHGRSSGGDSCGDR